MNFKKILPYSLFIFAFVVFVAYAYSQNDTPPTTDNGDQNGNGDTVANQLMFNSIEQSEGMTNTYEVEGALGMVVESQETWGKVAPQVGIELEDHDLDFSTQLVLLAMTDQKGSGGHSVQIDGIYQTSTGLTVELTETLPGKDCMSTSVMTRPFHLVTIDTADLSLPAYPTIAVKLTTEYGETCL